MLNDHDLDWLIKQLIDTSELLGQQVSPSAVAMLADELMQIAEDKLRERLKEIG